MNRNIKIEVAFPLDLYNSFEVLPEGHTFPCSALFNENIIGGLFITCTVDDLKFYNISKSKLPHPDLKFRMVNFLKKGFLIEILLYFGSKKIMRLHLNPVNENVKMLFKLLIEKELISFHFYNRQTDFLASAYTSIEEEHMEWVTRNNTLSSKLKSNKDYVQIANYITDTIESNERIFRFNDSKSVWKSFIKDNQTVVKLLS